MCGVLKTNLSCAKCKEKFNMCERINKEVDSLSRSASRDEMKEQSQGFWIFNATKENGLVL